MAQVSGWLGAGLLTAGVSAAVLAGAGAASADTEADSDSGTASTSAVSADRKDAEASSADRRTGGEAADPAEKDSRRAGAQPSDDPEGGDSSDASPRGDASTIDTVSTDDDDETVRGHDRKMRRVGEPASRATTPESVDQSSPIDEVDDQEDRSAQSSDSETPSAQTDSVAALTPAPSLLRTAGVEATPAEEGEAVGGIGDILGPFQPDYPPLVRAVGSAVFNLIGALVQAVDGPPAVPQELQRFDQGRQLDACHLARKRSCRRLVLPRRAVQPERLIYLQHGILASGPMYSHTASYLAAADQQRGCRNHADVQPVCRRRHVVGRRQHAQGGRPAVPR